MFHTLGYKGGYISIKTEGNKEHVTVMVSEYAMPVKVKSFRAGQLYITKTRKLEKECLQRMGLEPHNDNLCSLSKNS